MWWRAREGHGWGSTTSRLVFPAGGPVDPLAGPGRNNGPCDGQSQVNAKTLLCNHLSDITTPPRTGAAHGGRHLPMASGDRLAAAQTPDGRGRARGPAKSKETRRMAGP